MICFGIALHCSVRALHRPESLRHSVESLGQRMGLRRHSMQGKAMALYRIARALDGRATLSKA